MKKFTRSKYCKFFFNHLIENLKSSLFFLLEGQCGRRPLENLNGRIVGGEEVWYGQVPWQVLIKERRLFGLLNFRKCGGVLIAPRWVNLVPNLN